MKLLLVSSAFYPKVGGVEKVVEDLAENLSFRHDVCVLSSITELDKKNIFRVSSRIEDYKTFKLKRIWMNYPRNFVGAVVFPGRLFLSLVSLIFFARKFKPDLINLHFPDDVSLYMWVMTLFSKCPLIVNIHGNDLHVFSKKLGYKYFINGLVSKSKKVVVNSQYMKNEFDRRYPRYSRKVEIIANGLDVDAIKKVNPKTYFSEPYIFYVGRIVHKKGVDILLKAFKKADFKGCKLVIEGQGELLNNMEKLSEDLGLNQSVVFSKGTMSQSDKFAYMKGAVLGVMPSRIEPFGIVALEFMAAGTPLVASETGGLKYILRNKETCLFFDNKNADDLSRKMKEMFSDAKLRARLSKRGLEEASKYDNRKVAKMYENLFLKYDR